MKKSQAGNALFLILIAVALFAALSYAITQSTRGSGSVDKEQALLLAAQITQQGAGVATGVTRMLVTGTGAASLQFCDSQTICYSTVAPNDYCTAGTDCLWAPEGGGMTVP